jgi:CRP-like cAMP-binding protein
MALKHESLSEIALFAALNESEIQALAQRSVERRFASGEMLFWEGEPCTGIFLLTQGSAKIFKTSAAGREMMLSLEKAPCSVAELPLFDGGPYPASVRAVGPVLALFINKSDFHQVCRQFPDVALKVLAVVGSRLRHLVDVVESMMFGSVTQRLARLLLDISRQAGADEFDLALTHQELASRLGTVREVVSRNLARFRAEGIVRIQGHQLRIVDRRSLEREAEAEG